MHSHCLRVKSLDAAAAIQPTYSVLMAIAEQRMPVGSCFLVLLQATQHLLVLNSIRGAPLISFFYLR